MRPTALVTLLVGSMLLACSDNQKKETYSQEQRLLSRIQGAPAGPERHSLIDQLEDAPVHYRTFYERWLFVHEVVPWDCWSDEGYDPSKSTFPRDVQILAAADYGKADIDNGGLHQFFGNSTGRFAPEMVEWLERSGLTDAAIVLREAMQVFGEEFPRSQSSRQQVLAKFEAPTREEGDPFYEMDDRFFAATKDEVFEQVANNWLREMCGINRLRDGSQSGTR
ncbi:MAG: DMP19 family protein [Planctomycetaceae bacterium]